MKKGVFFIACLAFFAFFSFVKVEAYESVCKGTSINVVGGEAYYDCEYKAIYLHEDQENSSYLVANKANGTRYKLLYAGFIDGAYTFYSNGFNYLAKVYDNRGMFESGEDMWSDLSINGVVMYSGHFKDNFFIDQSHEERIKTYNEKGTYLIRNFIGGEIVKVIRVVIPKDIDLSVEEVLYGSNVINGESLMYDEDASITFKLAEGKYGYNRSAEVTINECRFNFLFEDVTVISDKGECFVNNGVNNVSLKLENGVGMSKTFSYQFNLYSETIKIELEDSVSTVVTNSRRIVIKSSPGLGNTLDESYNLYYWSTSPDDKLTYEDFMSNYDKSENKGSYTSNKGVILRDTEGTYYLYALAKDSESFAVVRSDEYVLEKGNNVSKVIGMDVVFVVAMCFVAMVPIGVYIIIRGKDTE